MILINGESRKTIEVADRGLQYGDGLFETIAVINNQPIFLDQHIDRLKIGCHKLHIPFPNLGQLRLEIHQLCCDLSSVLPSGKAVIKLLVTRGSGGRGYRQPDLIEATRVLSLHSFPHYPENYGQQGVKVRFCDTRLGLNPGLAGIKHLNRLEQVLARAEWNDPDIQEGIVLDINDYVIEGTMSNLFYVKNNTLYTASLHQSGVAGIMRDTIIALSSRHNLSVIEHAFTKDTLLSADETFISNSIIGIWPIKQIGDTFYKVGPITQQIQNWLRETIREEAGG